jgi:hypothetical protein
MDKLLSMKRVLILTALLLTLLDAKEYRSYAIGYTIDTSHLKDSSIQDTSTFYNYAYKLNSVYLTQNYLLLGELDYYPWQKFARGFQNGHRFESHIGMTNIDFEAGLKKYIIPYTYFAPTIGLKYSMYKSEFRRDADGYYKTTETDTFDLPLILNFGYSLTPTSDILIGFNIDEDLTDLNAHDYQEYMFRYYLTFKNNITINAMYNYISKLNPDDFRQITQQFSLTLGLRF